MPMRTKNVQRSQASSQTHSKGARASQFILSTRSLVPVAKSVPIARKKRPVEVQRKNRSYSTWKHETTTSFLKPPLVSTSGQGLPRSDLQDWIRDSRLAIDIDRASRCSLKDNGQKTMPAWKKLKQYREQIKMQSSENQQEELPFPYNPNVWKVQSGSSLLTMDSMLTLPQMEITSWESSIAAPESNLEMKNRGTVNDREKSINGKTSSTMEEFSESSRSSTISKSTGDDSKLTAINSKLTGYSASSEIHPPSDRSTLSKLVEQSSNKSILISSPDESQCTISTESEGVKVEEVVVEENAIWQGIDGILSPVLVTNPADRNTCGRRYSWQVVDSGLQTSRTLLDDLVKMEHERIEKEKEENAKLKCSYKYSWQIIGIETQTSPKDYEESSGRFELKSKPRDSSSWKATARRPRETSDRTVKFCTNEQTQTCASKENQTNFTEIYAMSRKASAKVCA